MPVMSKYSGAVAGAAALIGGATFVGLPAQQSRDAASLLRGSAGQVAASGSAAAAGSTDATSSGTSGTSSFGLVGVAGLAALALSGRRSSAAGRSSVVAVCAFDPSKEIGVCDPLLFWDPIGFCEGGTKEEFDRRRAVELKHGRICMFATIGR
eukprot:CAMPEP_0115092518 /NCGR_PEP_ID=MMETSP0227-20121206/26814_1 /TAXON_ID=89957 /ORGANISM="Polarella glacialis, Strain CCMP 1383" /LENGTH=152 /DNA_ID=CAMNT_0002484353 /DNA_START=58 /DNA_END=512 /DNA_ORIENTATION=+